MSAINESLVRKQTSHGLFVDDHIEVKVRDLNLPLYLALSGAKVWTPLYGSMEVLGSDMVRMRLRAAMSVLGGVSSKRLKKLEKEYAALLGRNHLLSG